MSRWFRWYEGTTEDGKFRVVARKSRVTVRDVIALWAFILEDAANLEHRGVCQRDEDFMSSVLDFEDGVVEDILSAMQDVGLVSVGIGAITICNFTKRQFESDVDKTAADRQRRKRERDRGDDHKHVTRDSRPPDTDTDTDTEEENNKGGYAFSGKVIRLTERDFARWQRSYPDLDLRSCLQSRDDWLGTQPEPERKRWFNSTSNWLAKKQQQIASERTRPLEMPIA